MALVEQTMRQPFNNATTTYRNNVIVNNQVPKYYGLPSGCLLL